MIRGALGTYAGDYGVDLFAYSFYPRGFWMVLSAPEPTLSEFMRDFQSWLARWVNRRLDREGRFFHDRFDADAILDTQMLVDKLVEVMSAPVREGYADRLCDYDGAQSFVAFRDGEDEVGPWIDRDRLRSLRRSRPEMDEMEVAEWHPVELASPPLGEVVDNDTDVRAWLTKKVLERCEAIREYRAGQKEEVLRMMAARPVGLDEVRSPLEPIGPPKYRYGRQCQTYSAWYRELYRWYRRGVTWRYRRRMTRWRNNTENGFPNSTYPPGWQQPNVPLDRRRDTWPRLHPG
jgi:hypothetical protein